MRFLALTQGFGTPKDRRHALCDCKIITFYRYKQNISNEN